MLEYEPILLDVGRCAWNMYYTILAYPLTLYTVNRWLSIRFNLFSAIIVGVAAFGIILTPTIDAALAGFILAFASTVTNDVSVASV
jgi:hypothetical protein